MKNIKLFLKNRSKLMLILTVLEICLALWILLAFNYSNGLNYADTLNYSEDNLTLLFESMYTSTWYGLIILSANLISICSLISAIYLKKEFHFLSISLWCILLLIALDFNTTLKANMATMAIFIPIILLNIVAYFNQKKLSESKKSRK